MLITKIYIFLGLQIIKFSFETLECYFIRGKKHLIKSLRCISKTFVLIKLSLFLLSL